MENRTPTYGVFQILKNVFDKLKMQVILKCQQLSTFVQQKTQTE